MLPHEPGVQRVTRFSKKPKNREPTRPQHSVGRGRVMLFGAVIVSILVSLLITAMDSLEDGAQTPLEQGSLFEDSASDSSAGEKPDLALPALFSGQGK